MNQSNPSYEPTYSCKFINLVTDIFVKVNGVSSYYGDSDLNIFDSIDYAIVFINEVNYLKSQYLCVIIKI